MDNSEITTITPEIVPVVVEESLMDSPPAWMVRMIKRQVKLDNQYETAKGLVADAYNDLLDTIDDINTQYGTDFSLSDAYDEYVSGYADDENEK